jgi:hypothetical protein
MKNFFRTAALALGAIAMTATSGIAAGYEATNISIPFSFRVAKKTMPAGTYRVDQEYGTEIATITNVQTADRVKVLRSNSVHDRGKVRLIFHTDANGYSLSSVR